jgi:hypothetical protein
LEGKKGGKQKAVIRLNFFFWRRHLIGIVGGEWKKDVQGERVPKRKLRREIEKKIRREGGEGQGKQRRREQKS